MSSGPQMASKSPSSSGGGGNRQRPRWGVFSWKTRVGISVSLLGAFGAYVGYLEFVKRMKGHQKRQERVKKVIGGHFELMDQNRKVRTSRDFLGKWVLLYFGFSHCPDICPDEMEKMVEAVDKLEKQKNQKIQPLFITVDPERDTPEVVGSYVKEFSDKLIGLTGTSDQIKAATKAFRVYYSAGPRGEGSDYIVDHTIITYLINPDGDFVDYYGQTKTADQIVNGVSTSIEKYNALQKKWWFF